MRKYVILIACGLILSNLVFGQKAKTGAASGKSEANEESSTAEPHVGLKLGWLNSAALLDAMPEKVKADSEIAKYARTFQEMIDGMGKEYQSKIQQYQSGEKTMTDAMKEVKQKEIQDLQNRIETTQQSAQEKVGMKKQEVYTPVLDKADIFAVQHEINQIGISETLERYIIELVFATRRPLQYGLKDEARYIQFGASPRASIAINRGAKVLAYFDDRDYVLPEDIKEIAPDVLNHRILLNYEAEADNVTTPQLIETILRRVAIGR